MNKKWAMLMVIALCSLIVLSPGATFAEKTPHGPIEENPVILYLLFDQLEYRTNGNRSAFHWDVEGRFGGDYNRLRVKTEGDQSLSNREGGEAEVQLLYSRLISPYFDLQAGVRHDEIYGNEPRRSRSFGVLGIQGLSQYWFEIELSLFFSERGDLSARFTGEYDLPITQRLILQPRVETNAAVQKVEAFGVGQGFNDVELGVRLRYEIRKEFAPYLGISWTRLLGETADFARKEGDDFDNLSFVVGIRMWF